MLKIRLMRIGAKQKPFYRIVVVDERTKRTGGYIDLLGTYNPMTEPKDIKLDKVKLAEWIKKGAQKSDGLLRILGEAPQRPPRKPKKEKKESKVTEKPSEEATTTKEPKATEETPATEEAAQQTETPAVETPSEETPPAETTEPVVEEKPDKIATEPEAPRNDEVKESEQKDEGSA